MSAVAYECDGCAACCCHFSVAVTREDRHREPLVNAQVLSPLEGGRVPLKMSGGERYMNWDYEGPCPLLTEVGQCSVHLSKPDICRLFKPGGWGCQWARGRSGLSPLHPVENAESQEP